MQFTDSFGAKKENEVTAYAFETECPNLLFTEDYRLQRKAVGLKGFIGVHSTPRGIAFIFRTEKQADAGRKWFIENGRRVGNVAEYYIDKKIYKDLLARASF